MRCHGVGSHKNATGGGDSRCRPAPGTVYTQLIRMHCSSVDAVVSNVGRCGGPVAGEGFADVTSRRRMRDANLPVDETILARRLAAAVVQIRRQLASSGTRAVRTQPRQTDGPTDGRTLNLCRTDRLTPRPRRRVTVWGLADLRTVLTPLAKLYLRHCVWREESLVEDDGTEATCMFSKHQ